MAAIAYDPNVDYMQLIMDAEKAGNRSLAAQYEAQRNAKIADLNAAGTNQWNAQQTYAYTQPKAQNTGAGLNTSVTVNNQSALIEDLYKAQQEAALAELKAAYDQNVLTMDAAAQKIPGVYRQSRNRAAADAAVNARNFNEYAAASGLSSGAAAQTQLAMNNQLTSGLSDIARQEADAMADLELERARMQTEYKNAVAQAIATGDVEKAKALYSEAVRVDEMMISQAYQNAQLALQQAQHERNLANDKFEQDLILAEQAATKQPTQYYAPPAEPVDYGKYYNAINTTVGGMQTATEANRAYLETYLATQLANGNITPEGVAAILANKGLA